MNKKILAFSVTFFTFFSFFSSHVDAMPVSDVGEWARTMQVFNQLRNQYQKLQEQYNLMNQQYGAMTGNSGWGGWENSDAILRQRQWAPADWESSLKGLSGGNPGRYEQLMEQYKVANPAMSQSAYQKGKDAPLAQGYQQKVAVNQASHTMASYVFDDINTHLKSLHDLGLQIENADKNKTIKSSVDLNSRITLEVAYISIEELRMQALINQQMAALQMGQLTEENEASQFNQAGDRE